MINRVIKRIFVGCVVITLAMTFVACGSSGSASFKASETAYTDDYGNGAYYDYDYDYEESMVMSDGTNSVDTSTTENASTTNRKLIRTVNLSVETKEFDNLVTSLENQVEELGGYVESMDGYYGSRYASYKTEKNATMVARIPSKSLDGFLNNVGEQSNIVNKSENVSDVTLDYVDMDSHKRMLEEEQDRLLAFLDEAETIEDIITIEDRLTTVRYQLESMESQLRTYDNKIDYSTVTIHISEVIDYTVIAQDEQTPIERMKEGFVSSLRNIGNGIKEFGIWFVINLPYIVLYLILACIGLLIYKFVSKKNAIKAERIKAERAAKAAQIKENGLDVTGEEAIFVKRPEKTE